LNLLPTTQAEARDERRRAAVVEEAAQRARQEGRREGNVLGNRSQKSVHSDFIESTLTRAMRGWEGEEGREGGREGGREEGERERKRARARARTRALSGIVQ